MYTRWREEQKRLRQQQQGSFDKNEEPETAESHIECQKPAENDQEPPQETVEPTNNPASEEYVTVDEAESIMMSRLKYTAEEAKRMAKNLAKNDDGNVLQKELKAICDRELADMFDDPTSKTNEEYVTRDQAEETVISRLGVEKEEASKMVEKMNTNEEGQIYLKELTDMCDAICKIKENLMVKLKLVDKENNGYISPEEAKEFLQKYMSKMPEKTINHIIKKFDRQDNGQVDFESFVFFYAHISAKISSLRIQFEALDVDQDGKLSSEELKERLMYTCGIKSWQADSLIMIFDDSADGHINRNEFNAMLDSVFGEHEQDSGNEEYITIDQAEETVVSRLGITKDEAQKMVEKLDTNQEGKLCHTELTDMCNTICKIKEDLMEKLKLVDKDNNGYISPEEAKEFLQKYMEKIPEKTINHIIKKFDRQDNGQVDYESFVFFYAHISAKISSLKSQFSALDVDGDGRLSTEELKDRLMYTCGLQSWQADSLFMIFDDNEDGHINRDEFSAMLESVFGSAE